jgi:hypothetical protein
MARKYLQVYMDETAVEAVTEHAKERGYKLMTDYLRDLIKQDMEKNGKIVDFGIDRGGWRGGGKNDE